MTTEEEVQEYRNTLDKGIILICEAMGVEPERYDTDQADFECYLDCFREAADLIKKAGYKFDDDTGEFVSA